MSKETYSMLDIRNAMYDTVKEKFGAKSATGSGGLVCPPFTVDFDFEINGIVYRVDMTNMTCKKCLKKNNDECPEKNCPLEYDFEGRSEGPKNNCEACCGSCESRGG